MSASVVVESPDTEFVPLTQAAGLIRQSREKTLRMALRGLLDYQRVDGRYLIGVSSLMRVLSER